MVVVSSSQCSRVAGSSLKNLVAAPTSDFYTPEQVYIWYGMYMVVQGDSYRSNTI